MPKKKRLHKGLSQLAWRHKGAEKGLLKLHRSAEELQKLLAELEISKKQP